MVESDKLQYGYHGMEYMLVLMTRISLILLISLFNFKTFDLKTINCYQMLLNIFTKIFSA